MADAIVRELDMRVGGALDLAADPPITTWHLADALDAQPLHVPAPLVRVVMSAAWHARLQQVDTGWLDMGFALPCLNCSRGATMLGWSPTVDAVTVLAEVVEGMRQMAADRTPVLRRRTVSRALQDLVRRGPTGQRTRP